MTNLPSLDPTDWQTFRDEAHRALDQAINHMQGRQDDPVWQPVPSEIRTSLKADLPRQGQAIDRLTDQMADRFLPYGVGNTHARFFGWVHGAGTPQGILPDIMAAAMNANLGGRDHVANLVEKQVIDWMRQAFDFPDTSGGLVVSGTSVATLIAIKSAREKHGGLDLRRTGLGRATKQLVGYASDQAHSCIARTFDILGLGQDALRMVPTDGDYRMDAGALKTMIAQDLTAGHQPFCLVGTAGAVNVGAIDPLETLAEIAREHNMWFHVDGAFGATAVLSDAQKPLLAGLSQADSIAFDFHKWLHVNYDAGFILMRDVEDQWRAFTERPDYLEGAERGLAAGNPWFCEYGPELSRGFRALKIWFHLMHFGTDRLGGLIAQNCDQAKALAGMVERSDRLELLAPVALNITCFRYNPGDLDGPDLDRLNGEIVVALQERGLAAPSTTKLKGHLAIRVNITNHRTTLPDLEFLVDHIEKLGQEITASNLV